MQRVRIERVDHLDRRRARARAPARGRSSRHIGSPASASPRTRLAAVAHATVPPAGDPGSVRGRRAAATWSIAVSEQSDSRSPIRPQLQRGRRPSMPLDALIRDQHVPELAAEAVSALDDAPSTMTPPPRPVPMTAEIEVAARLRAEDREMPPERGGVAVVEIDDRDAQTCGEAGAADRSRPTPRARSSSSRARSARPPRWRAPACPGRPPRSSRSARPPASTAIARPSAICCRQSPGPFLGPRRVLAQAVDQKPSVSSANV